MTRSNARNALVTGGHGFLGSHLVDLLLERGFQVRCLVRPERPLSVLAGRHVEVVRGDLRDTRGLADAVRDVDHVFHVAGLVAARGPSEFRAVNVDGTRRLATAVARANPGCRRFLYVSSLAAAGPSRDGRPVSEERPSAPVSHYGKSKLLGEHALAEALDEVSWTVVRPPAIYGPRDEGILPFFQLAARGLRCGLDGRGRRFNLLHARDVAEGMLAAALAPEAANRTYFLSDTTGYTYGDVGRTLEQAFACKTRRLPLPDLVVDAAAVLADEIAALAGSRPVFSRDKARELKARWWLCSGERAAREVGWQPRIALDDGFRETARWYIAHGKVKAPPGVPSPL